MATVNSRVASWGHSKRIMHVPVHDGIDRLIKSYKAVICDIWGVVHNGVAPYPGLLDCLARIRAAGLPVLLLSNAPRPSPYIQEFLTGIGVTEAHYDHIVTSGDVTVAAINRRIPQCRFICRRFVCHIYMRSPVRYRVPVSLDWRCLNRRRWIFQAAATAPPSRPPSEIGCRP